MVNNDSLRNLQKEAQGISKHTLSSILALQLKFGHSLLLISFKY